LLICLPLFPEIDKFRHLAHSLLIVYLSDCKFMIQPFHPRGEFTQDPSANFPEKIAKSVKLISKCLAADLHRNALKRNEFSRGRRRK
jgi:hypothetical protein